MLRILVYTLFFIIPFGYSSNSNPEPIVAEVIGYESLYSEMQLEGEVSFIAFEQAMKGYERIGSGKKGIITLIDFSKPSTQDRLYILDLDNKKIILSSLVAHGKGSGDKYAKYFSNKNGSHKSSLGFYMTGNTYDGRCGYSLVLNGLEKGINDKALQRGIVIHGADYSNPSVIASSGRLGRSFGCPAVPEALNEEIINIIKGGTLLYIYAHDATYKNKSVILSRP